MPLVVHHLGTLRACETALVLVVAFGPLMVIAGLVLRDRRRAAARDHAEDTGAERSGRVGGEPRG